MNVEVSPRSLFIESSSWLKARMVLEVTLLFTRSSSALVIFNVMVLPLMAQVPRIVPVTPWESVLLMNPWGRNCAMKLPPPLKVIDSFMLPTVPSQLPTIFALYSASATGLAGVQDETPKANASSRPSRPKLRPARPEPTNETYKRCHCGCRNDCAANGQRNAFEVSAAHTIAAYN